MLTHKEESDLLYRSPFKSQLIYSCFSVWGEGIARLYGLDDGTTPEIEKGRATDTAARDITVKTVKRLVNCILSEVYREE